jgi:hypothetical protein
MNKIIKVISSQIDETGRRLIKSLGWGADDVQETLNVAPFGDDSCPVKDMVAIYATTSDIGNPVVIGYVNKNQIADVGEKRIFSTNADGVEQIALHLKNDGTAEFGGNTDFMVRYSELEVGFNALKSDFNSLVTSYNSHIHITTATVSATAVPGVIAPTPSTGTPSTADISGSKIDEIKTI